MPITIPSERGEPTIKIFESLEELYSNTGQSVCHGFYDAKSNTIVATADSVAHEVGHYLDVKSGGYLHPEKQTSPSKRTGAILRNEIVAVLFAFTKCGEGGTSLLYEARFVEWLAFTRKAQGFGPHSDKNLAELNLKEIQSLADWLVSQEHSSFDRLCFFFRSYLADEKNISTYGRTMSITLKGSG